MQTWEIQAFDNGFKATSSACGLSDGIFSRRHACDAGILWFYTKCSWSCSYSGALRIVISRFYPLWRDLNHRHPPPPPPFHSVSFHCAGFLHIISLVQWHGHPSEQCVQYLIPNYKSWEASRRFHVASASPAVAAACGVYVQLTVASCFLILQEPSWDYRIVQVEGTISSCHWVYASIQIADFLVRKSQSCSGFCLYYKMCSITLFCSLHFHTENTLVFPRKPYCVIWSERMKCF